MSIKIKKLPDAPGVYLFKRGRKILYIGKATSLRVRVGSYFSSQSLDVSRGQRIIQMLALATKVDFVRTGSVLEALLLETRLIKKHQPKYNVKAKDNKSYWYVVVTAEKFPRVLAVRGQDQKANEVIYGPFPNASELRAALKIMRRIFPWRDTCLPNQNRPCFNYQLGLCPGVCVGVISAVDYHKNIKQIKLLFRGRKKSLIAELTGLMSAAAARRDFEQAANWRDKIFSLQHIADVSMIKTVESRSVVTPDMRIEAYDIAHLAGGAAVGVMVVAENGEFKKSAYRKFKVSHGADDLANLREVLERRFQHDDWPVPDLVVIDGGTNQWRAARGVMADVAKAISLVAVVKDERHQPREIIGDQKAALDQRAFIFRLAHEAHRFAVTYHRARRRKISGIN